MTYGAAPASRVVAGRVRAQFERHSEPAEARSAGAVAPLPDLYAIEVLIEAGFWTSLRREEGYLPRISLALTPPDVVNHPLLFAEPIPLDPAELARVAPAVERPGIHLGVWNDAR